MIWQTLSVTLAMLGIVIVSAINAVNGAAELDLSGELTNRAQWFAEAILGAVVNGMSIAAPFLKL